MAARRQTAPDTAAASGTHYTVLARRWRPQQFDHLVGQEAISQALKGAITSGRVAHAYLFTGARGVGKTSAARILAKALNCKTGPTITPCDKCDACESIASGDDVDVLEIDGASNRGIDEVRELRQNVHFRPTRARYKIYIIDEVHMLTREAFNALLKTLEEPPSHVKFVFATTDPQKIPITILSRCQRFDFGTISNERIEKRLQEIIRAEKIPVDAEAQELIARRAAGSMRDSLSLLDQLLAFGGERVTTDQVHRLLGTAREDRLLDLVSSLVERKAGAAIELVDQAETEGVQLGELIDQVIEYFRDLMVLQSAGPQARLVSVSSRQRSRIAEQAGRLSPEFVFAATDILAETKGRLRGSSHGRVLLDIALVRIASLEELSSLGEVVERLAAIESRSGGSTARQASAAPPPAHVSAAPDSKKNFVAANAPHFTARDIATRAVAAAASRPVQPIEASAAAPAVSVDLPDESTLESAPQPVAIETGPPSEVAGVDSSSSECSKGVGTPPSAQPLTAQSATELLRELSQDLNPLLRESISRARLSIGPAADQLVVHLDALYNTASRTRELETVLQQRVGSAVRVRVELHAAADSPAREAAARRPSYTERLGEASRDPLVQQAIELFGARVTRVEAE
jgi:DNA polymerase-3 subunit gamma/tau